MAEMEGILRNAIFEGYGLCSVLGYEESDQRGYLTFSSNQGTYVAVLAKYSNEIWYYKFEKRMKINDED